MLAIIGGTGLYNIDGLDVIEEHDIDTPFGKPSDLLIRGKYGDNEIIFLPRHGKGHRLLPHEVNYRANIWALKKMGVTRIIGVSAVGSLKEEIKPGDIALPDQYFDFVKQDRKKTFFGNGIVAHISSAQPVCKNLEKEVVEAGNRKGLNIHRSKTYGCVDGPRLGTRAESFFLRGEAGCDLVGMTNVPEVFLAREAQICYLTIAIATDYDCWMDDPAHHVTLEQVMQRYGQSLGKVKGLLENIFSRNITDSECSCRTSLASAVLTDEASLSNDNAALLAVLRA